MVMVDHGTTYTCSRVCERVSGWGLGFESDPLRAVQLSRHTWLWGIVNQDSGSDLGCE